MNADEFAKWLKGSGTYKSDKQRSDCVSRAKRVEKAFAEAFPGFSYENEYAKDQCKSLMALLSRRGIAIDFKIKLPLGSNQMDCIVSAAKKYIKFLDQQ